MSQRVSFVSPVALAIWEILQDCRNWILLSILRQPDASRQRRTVFQRYQRVLDNTHSVWKIRDNHGGPLMMVAVCRPAAASEEDKASEENNR
jgi:hypothetical protein